MWSVFVTMGCLIRLLTSFVGFEEVPEGIVDDYTIHWLRLRIRSGYVYPSMQMSVMAWGVSIP